MKEVLAQVICLVYTSKKVDFVLSLFHAEYRLFFGHLEIELSVARFASSGASFLMSPKQKDFAVSQEIKLRVSLKRKHDGEFLLLRSRI